MAHPVRSSKNRWALVISQGPENRPVTTKTLKNECWLCSIKSLHADRPRGTADWLPKNLEMFPKIMSGAFSDSTRFNFNGGTVGVFPPIPNLLLKPLILWVSTLILLNLWLKRHPNVHFHFTPTGASWLNQVEVWFSILSRATLKGASFTSPQQVRDAITTFIAVHNEKAAPFQWRKKSVGRKGLKKTLL